MNEIWDRKKVSRIMRCEKSQITKGIELINQEIIRTLGEWEMYEWLWILEADIIKQEEKKEK